MFRVSGRRLKILIGIVAAVIVLGGVLLAVLPEIVRRVAIAQVPKLTGRVLLLDDVDLNVFTGHLALKGVKVQKAGTNERAYDIARIDVRLDYLPFFGHHVRVAEITIVAAQIQVCAAARRISTSPTSWIASKAPSRPRRSPRSGW
jgi:uncharacterized protein involved in outer membrane biogenesis